MDSKIATRSKKKTSNEGLLESQLDFVKPLQRALSSVEQAELKELYRQMVTIRRLEEACAKAYSQGKMGGFLHLVIGQESSCVGSIAALEPTDYVFASYREHGHCMAKAGVTSENCKAVMAELLGKVTGISKGLGGSMHLFDAKSRFMGGYGIVGGQVPLAAGVAFASKYNNTGEVTLCFLGDGAISQGAFHEALHLSGLWKLPVVFICENNQYAMGTPLSRTTPVMDLAQRAQSSYAMRSDRFDSDDVLFVKHRIAEAVKAARQGIPSLIEIVTYRYRGHSISDPGTYRTKEEVEEWRKKDAVLLARTKLLEYFSPEQLDTLDEEIKSVVQQAVLFAETSPVMAKEELWNYIYADSSLDPKRM